MKMKTLNTEDSVILVASWNDYWYLIVIWEPGVMRFMGSQKSDMTEQLNWTKILQGQEFNCFVHYQILQT